MADIARMGTIDEVNAESNAAASFDNILSTLNICLPLLQEYLFVGGIE